MKTESSNSLVTTTPGSGGEETALHSSSVVEMVADIAVDLIGARRHPLVSQVEKNIREKCGVSIDAEKPTPVNIVLGVSGGADSVALLLTLCSIRDRQSTPLNLHAVHVNHNLREDADQDEAFVIKLCKTLEVPCTVKHIHPAEEGGNIYAAARKLRYHAFKETAHTNNSEYVAVAHHADDQFETILMNLCRGCDIDGAVGMSWKRTLEENSSNLYLIRPLLDIPKSDCISICKTAKVNWIEDPANQDVDRTRARLRADILPVLNELWPGAAKRAVLTMESIAASKDAVNTVIEDKFGEPSNTKWQRNTLSDLPVQLITAGLRRAATNLMQDNTGIDSLDRQHLQTVAQAIIDNEKRPRTFNWPSGITVTVSSKVISIAAN